MAIMHTYSLKYCILFFIDFLELLYFKMEHCSLWLTPVPCCCDFFDFVEDHSCCYCEVFSEFCTHYGILIVYDAEILEIPVNCWVMRWDAWETKHTDNKLHVQIVPVCTCS